MKIMFLFLIAAFANAKLAQADGSRGCPDDAVSFVCQCQENSRNVLTAYSRCVDQTAPTYKREKASIAHECESRSTEKRDCVITGVK